MIRGIAIMGLNGCEKSTLAHTIAKRLDFYEMDVEDYYFPEQKNSRQAVLEQQYDVKCEYKGELPYSMPRSAKEVQEILWNLTATTRGDTTTTPTSLPTRPTARRLNTRSLSTNVIKTAWP